ncbi:hypothetical protein [Rhodopseudomonas palustris]|uniref:Uncharacterized protein n=1 Tax=Rhodopseudomonas palustris (strain BisB18) TaxID=316056 RepID=Q219Y1_RHOPB
MNGDQPISWLMFFTLAAGVVIVGAVFLNFIRSRSNREAAENALEGDGRSRGAAPSGALPELLGITAFALIAMGLLAVGQNNKPSVETAQLPGQVGTTTGQGQGNMQDPGSFNQPKRYQPANPGTDNRVAPTGSDTGVGASPGNTGTPTK